MVIRSHKQGGRRGQVRHNIENAGGLALLGVILGRVDGLSSGEALAIMATAGVVMSGLAKAWNEHGLTGKLLAKIGLVLPLIISVGCAGIIGTSKPEAVDVGNGETIIAHEITGVAWAFWDAGIGQNVEGGSGGEVTVGIVEAAGRVLAAIFGGLGAGLASTADALDPPPETLDDESQPQPE